ncbi:hypothetical protein GJ496_002606 [Pomphorhynchus laevis]|nr:hypothetical protein GJ496_002606 [Pomphorhynchus laevis]
MLITNTLTQIEKGSTKMLDVRFVLQIIELLKSEPNGQWRRMVKSNKTTVRFCDILWIGAHNAGTDKLHFHHEFDIFYSTDGNTKNVLCSISQRYGHIPVVRQMTSYVTMNQIHNISTLLNLGVRFFDMDICIDRDTRELAICHCLFGESLSLTLNYFKQWLWQNPDEFLTLTFKDGIINANIYYSLVTKIYIHLRSFLIEKRELYTDLNILSKRNHRVFLSIHGDEYMTGKYFQWVIKYSFITRGKYSNFHYADEVMLDQKKQMLSSYSDNTFNILHAYRQPNSLNVFKTHIGILAFNYKFFNNLNPIYPTAQNELNEEFYDIWVSEEWNEMRSKINVILLNHIGRNTMELFLRN